MTLGDPLVVSENISYQNVAIQEDYMYDQVVVAPQALAFSYDERKAPAAMAPKPVVNYKPQVLKLTQNVSILFEIK